MSSFISLIAGGFESFPVCLFTNSFPFISCLSSLPIYLLNVLILFSTICTSLSDYIGINLCYINCYLFADFCLIISIILFVHRCLIFMESIAFILLLDILGQLQSRECYQPLDLMFF